MTVNQIFFRFYLSDNSQLLIVFHIQYFNILKNKKEETENVNVINQFRAFIQKPATLILTRPPDTCYLLIHTTLTHPVSLSSISQRALHLQRQAWPYEQMNCIA